MEMNYILGKDIVELATTEAPPEDPVQQLQQIVYIVAGVLGGVCLILLIFTISLCTSVSKLQKQLKGPSTKVKKGKVNEAADLKEIETRFSQYPPVQPQTDRPQGGPYPNPADYSAYGGASRYEQPMGSRPMGLNRIPLAGQAAPQQQQPQQPRGLRNYDNYGY